MKPFDSAKKHTPWASPESAWHSCTCSGPHQACSATDCKNIRLVDNREAIKKKHFTPKPFNLAKEEGETYRTSPVRITILLFLIMGVALAFFLSWHNHFKALVWTLE